MNMNRFVKSVLSAGVVMVTTQLMAETKSKTLAECEAKYKELQETLWAHEQSTQVQLYDYIETVGDYERYVEALKKCTSDKESVKAIRTCVQEAAKAFPY